MGWPLRSYTALNVANCFEPEKVCPPDVDPD
jgi:hypothetical protein